MYPFPRTHAYSPDHFASRYNMLAQPVPLQDAVIVACPEDMTNHIIVCFFLVICSFCFLLSSLYLDTKGMRPCQSAPLLCSPTSCSESWPRTEQYSYCFMSYEPALRGRVENCWCFSRHTHCSSWPDRCITVPTVVALAYIYHVSHLSYVCASHCWAWTLSTTRSTLHFGRLFSLTPSVPSSLSHN